MHYFKHTCATAGLVIFLFSALLLTTRSPDAASSTSGELMIDLSPNRKVADLKHDKTPFMVGFRLLKPAKVMLQFRNEVGDFVRTITKNLNSGWQTVKWDLRDKNGKPVPNGIYEFVVHVSAKGASKIYDSAPETYGLALLTVPKKVGPDGLIEYDLPQPALVQIRMGFRESVMVKTLLDWKPQIAGHHKLIWDGFDDSGVKNYKHDPEVVVAIDAFSIAQNSVIVRNSPSPTPTYDHRKLVSVFKRKLPKGKHQHAYHGRPFCREPQLSLALPGAKFDKKKNSYKVSGTQNITLNASKGDAFKLHHVHFEIMFYIDKAFLFEDEDSFFPYTYTLDTKKLKNGEHVLTVNIADYDMHLGVAAVRLFVNN